MSLSTPTPDLDPGRAHRQHKDATRNRIVDIYAAGRDVGAIPEVADPARRLACSLDFRVHCQAYHGATFSLAWSEDHLKVMAQIEEAVLRGGLFATAMPRGSGKTSLAEVACIWATLNGHHPFVCLIGSDEGAAEEMLDSIKTELEVNALLLADYPEALRPVAKLEGISNRCRGQTYGEERTRIEWTSKAIVLPSLKPAGWGSLEGHRSFVRPDGFSLSSGAVLKVAGLTGGIRGMKHKRADGVTVRPTLVVPDDPQTDASARSPSQCETRERILAGAVLGLAGPGKKISGLMPCTVIRAGDMADTLLDRDKHPEWHGTRTKMVYSFPASEKLWEEYARLRADGLKAEDDGRAATEFYREHQAEMDAGSRVAWPQRHNEDELSAIQHAMNLRFDRGERAFFAEYQNEPLPEAEARADDLTPDAICSKFNRQKRGAVPVTCSRLTGFIDVQGSLLYYSVCAWDDDFTGYLIDYGSFPDQKRPYFTLRDAKNTLERVTKAPDLEGRIYQGLDALTTILCGREWPRDDGAAMKLDRLLIDANWGLSTAVVKQFCRQSAHSAVLSPSHGKFIGAASNPMAEWPRRAGERAGLNWRLRALEGSRSVRSVIYDTNWWKSFLHTRLSVPMGSRTCLSLFGDKPSLHRLLADHLCAEFRVATEGRGRQVDEWKIRAERPDNHYLDALVGCCVAASMQGVALPESSGSPAARPGKVSFKDLQDRKRA